MKYKLVFQSNYIHQSRTHQYFPLQIVNLPNFKGNASFNDYVLTHYEYFSYLRKRNK